MEDCCGGKGGELLALPERQKRVLWIALFINLAMFGIEGAYGMIAGSTALLADSLDMLGDAAVYGVSLYAVGRSARWSASISLLKGLAMGSFGAAVLAQAVYRYFAPGLPEPGIMGVVGGLALLANLTCAVLLLRHRNDDLNMRSTWLCSRNDVLANLGVILAAGLVRLTQTRHPDLVVGVAIAALVLRSSYRVLKESVGELKSSRASRESSWRA